MQEIYLNRLFSKRILKGVWEATVEILAEIGVVFLKKPNLWHAYRYTALSLKEYFHAGGDGLTGDDLDNLEFKVNIAHYKGRGVEYGIW